MIEESINLELKMVASHVFNDILLSIQNSGLNFQLQISPFSAFISLKKSLLSDKNGSPIFPNNSFSTTTSAEECLLSKLQKLQKKYEDAMIENETAQEHIHILKTKKKLSTISSLHIKWQLKQLWW